MKHTRLYVVHGTKKDSGAYVEKDIFAMTSKQAFDMAIEQYPDITFVSSRKKGCNCGK